MFRGDGNDEENPANFGVFPTALDAVKGAVMKELGHEFKSSFSEKVHTPRKGESAIEYFFSFPVLFCFGSIFLYFFSWLY